MPKQLETHCVRTLQFCSPQLWFKCRRLSEQSQSCWVLCWLDLFWTNNVHQQFFCRDACTDKCPLGGRCPVLCIWNQSCVQCSIVSSLQKDFSLGFLPFLRWLFLPWLHFPLGKGAERRNQRNSLREKLSFLVTSHFFSLWKREHEGKLKEKEKLVHMYFAWHILICRCAAEQGTAICKIAARDSAIPHHWTSLVHQCICVTKAVSSLERSQSVLNRLWCCFCHSVLKSGDESCDENITWLFITCFVTALEHNHVTKASQDGTKLCNTLICL